MIINWLLSINNTCMIIQCLLACIFCIFFYCYCYYVFFMFFYFCYFFYFLLGNCLLYRYTVSHQFVAQGSSHKLYLSDIRVSITSASRKAHRTPVLIIILFYMIYSLCKNNAISKKYNFKPKFWINYRPFTIVVLCTQTLHQQWLHTRTCYKNHRSATIMVIKIEHKIIDQIGVICQFLAKKSVMLKLWRRLCAKRLHWQSCHLGGSYLFMKFDVFRQNAEFF